MASGRIACRPCACLGDVNTAGNPAGLPRDIAISRGMRFIVGQASTLLCLPASVESADRHRRQRVLTVSAHISRRRFSACLHRGDASARLGPASSLGNRCVIDKQRQRLSQRVASTRAFAVPAGGGSQPLQQYTSTLSGKPFWSPRTPIAHGPIYAKPSIAPRATPASWGPTIDGKRHLSHKAPLNSGWISAMTGFLVKWPIGGADAHVGIRYGA